MTKEDWNQIERLGYRQAILDLRDKILDKYLFTGMPEELKVVWEMTEDLLQQ